ncbi:hypothetical protein BJ165DRAFT_1053628 [Panaeolus papilionaceus]|nr:hypothetical protein BJ165DRAFT_1053628 [Panaeolus papilionaceus]
MIRHDNRNRLVAFWISRSRDTPVRIRSKLCTHPFDITLWEPIKHAERRWEKVDFDLSEDESLEPFSPNVSYPFLRSVCLRNPTLDEISAERTKNLSIALSNAPNLHDFAWEVPRYIHFEPTLFQLNWAQMTRIVLYHAMTAQQCYDLLALTPNIVSLTLNQIHVSAEVVGDQLTLPYLTSIGLTFDPDMTPEFLFDALTLPALRDLLISCPEVWPEKSFMDFLNRSKCKLESLNFYYHPLRESEIIDYLSANQDTLMEITIQGYHGQLTDKFLEKLTDNGTDPVWCPNLQIMAIYNALNCSPGSLARMARSRLDIVDTAGVQDRSASPPRRLPLRVMELYHSEPEVEYLEELRELGLVIIQYDSEGKQMPFNSEDLERLRRYKREGMILHSYASQIGFGPTETEEFD